MFRMIGLKKSWILGVLMANGEPNSLSQACAILVSSVLWGLLRIKTDAGILDLSIEECVIFLGGFGESFDIRRVANIFQ